MAWTSKKRVLSSVTSLVKGRRERKSQFALAEAFARERPGDAGQEFEAAATVDDDVLRDAVVVVAAHGKLALSRTQHTHGPGSKA